MRTTHVLARTQNAACGPAIVHLRGELDIATSDDLRSVLLAAGRANAWVCVDLSEVAFLDASILDVLVAADLACRALGGSLAVWNASSRQRRLFELCQLEGLLGEMATASEAVTSPP